MKFFSSALCIICILFLTHFTLLAQENTFEKTFGGYANDMGHDAILSGDGNIILTGAKTNADAILPDAYIAKISMHGDIIWENSFGTQYEEGGNEIALAENGNYFIAGHVDITGADACDALFFMINENGDTLWTSTFGFEGDDVAYSCTRANDGGYISVGKVVIAENVNAFVVKHNEIGEILWSKVFGNEEEDFATSVKQVEDGYFVTGRSTTNNNSDFWLMKLNNAGEMIWEKTYYNDGKDYPYSVQIAADGGCLIAGKEDLGAGITTILLIRTDNEGNLIWETKYGNYNNDFAKGIALGTNGNWIIGGSLYNVSNHSQDMMMMQVNDDGVISSVRFFGDDMLQSGNSLCSDGVGGYLMAGTSENMDMENMDILLTRTDENGIVNSIMENHAHQGMEVSAYPNPGVDVINFTISHATEIMHFKLMDPNGKIVFQLNNVISQQFSIQTNALMPGLYFYRVTNDNVQSLAYGKIVVLK